MCLIAASCQSFFFFNIADGSWKVVSLSHDRSASKDAQFPYTSRVTQNAPVAEIVAGVLSPLDRAL